MEIIGYVAATLIGISLGLIGGGGSILTVPVLVYLFGISPTVAVPYSLFIVGSTSLTGAVTNYFRGNVDFKTTILFGTSSIITVFLTRKFIIPLIPSTITKIGGFTVTFSFLTMVLFAILMLVSAISMINRSRMTSQSESVSSSNKLSLIVSGFLLGLITGFLGAGGGFLLIPTLVLGMKLSMKKAIGTSLLIISVNSLIGFLGDLGHLQINWQYILLITALAIVGVLVGNKLNKILTGEKLRVAFGWFVLLMGIFILVKEIILNK